MGGGSDVHDISYYQKCMVGGILSCGITHTLVCPLDIVKCRMQVGFSSNLYYQIMKLKYQCLLRHALILSISFNIWNSKYLNYCFHKGKPRSI